MWAPGSVRSSSARAGERRRRNGRAGVTGAGAGEQPAPAAPLPSPPRPAAARTRSAREAGIQSRCTRCQSWRAPPRPSPISTSGNANPVLKPSDPGLQIERRIQPAQACENRHAAPARRVRTQLPNLRRGRHRFLLDALNRRDVCSSRDQWHGHAALPWKRDGPAARWEWTSPWRAPVRLNDAFVAGNGFPAGRHHRLHRRRGSGPFVRALRRGCRSG